MNDRTNADGRQRHQPPLAAYCLASGVIATAAATVLSFTVSGAASFAVWISVLVMISAFAGLGYDSALVGAVWAALRRPRGKRCPRWQGGYGGWGSNCCSNSAQYRVIVRAERAVPGGREIIWVRPGLGAVECRTRPAGWRAWDRPSMTAKSMTAWR